MTSIGDVVTGARCWGIELDPRYRVLAVTVEPDPLRITGTVGEHQLLCFPVSVLLVTVTRPVLEDGASRTAVVTFDLEQLTSVSERFGGAVIEKQPFGLPEPRPGAWGPRYSLEGRTSAADGTRATLTLDLRIEDDARLQLFARFDDIELRDPARRLVLGTTQQPFDPTSLLGTHTDGGVVRRGTEDQHATGHQNDVGPEAPPEPLRF